MISRKNIEKFGIQFGGLEFKALSIKSRKAELFSACENRKDIFSKLNLSFLFKISQVFCSRCIGSDVRAQNIANAE